jgi:hypothetical protein
MPTKDPKFSIQAAPKTPSKPTGPVDGEPPTRGTRVVQADDTKTPKLAKPITGPDNTPVVFAKSEDPPKDPEQAPIVPPQLQQHDLDIPQEPEQVDVNVQVWDPKTQTFVIKSLGSLLLVPTGCVRPEYLPPYETKASLKSALPRDRAADANLFAMYQTNGWMGRHTIMRKLDEGINIPAEDKEIADDIPIILAIAGKPDPAAGVGGTQGVPPTPGSNNGAPLPPGPGPGRGNKSAPGDNAAKPKPPPNAAPGTGV